MKEISKILGIHTVNVRLYRVALSHRSVRESADENNERLEYLGDAVMSSIVADYLFRRYPYREEGFLTEMRSKMVNRLQLNDIAVKMGLKQVTIFNKFDSTLRNSHIFGNTLEALVGAIYLDKGYLFTHRWVFSHIIFPYMSMDDLESLDINLKNKLIGWASKNGKTVTFQLGSEQLQGGRKYFTMYAVVEGELIAEGNGYSKKDASQIAAEAAVRKLGL